MIISGEIWILYANDEPNDSKALKNNTCTCPYCNFQNLKFALQISQTARHYYDFAMQIRILHHTFAICKIFERNRSLIYLPLKWYCTVFV